MPDTQRSLVLDALQDGCETTREIQAYTELPRGICAAYLTRLKRDGWLDVVGSARFGGRGRHGFRWKLKRLGQKGAA